MIAAPSIRLACVTGGVAPRQTTLPQPALVPTAEPAAALQLLRPSPTTRPTIATIHDLRRWLTFHLTYPLRVAITQTIRAAAEPAARRAPTRTAPAVPTPMTIVAVAPSIADGAPATAATRFAQVLARRLAAAPDTVSRAAAATVLRPARLIPLAPSAGQPDAATVVETVRRLLAAGHDRHTRTTERLIATTRTTEAKTATALRTLLLTLRDTATAQPGTAASTATPFPYSASPSGSTRGSITRHAASTGLRLTSRGGAAASVHHRDTEAQRHRAKRPLRQPRESHLRASVPLWFKTKENRHPEQREGSLPGTLVPVLRGLCQAEILRSRCDLRMTGKTSFQPTTLKKAGPPAPAVATTAAAPATTSPVPAARLTLRQRPRGGGAELERQVLRIEKQVQERIIREFPQTVARKEVSAATALSPQLMRSLTDQVCRAVERRMDLDRYRRGR